MDWSGPKSSSTLLSPEPAAAAPKEEAQQVEEAIRASLETSMQQQMQQQMQQMQRGFEAQMQQQPWQLQQQQLLMQQQAAEVQQGLQTSYMQQQQLNQQQQHTLASVQQVQQNLESASSPPRKTRVHAISTPPLLERPQAQWPDPQVLQHQVLQQQSLPQMSMQAPMSFHSAMSTSMPQQVAVDIPTSPLTVAEVSSLPVDGNLHVTPDDSTSGTTGSFAMVRPATTDELEDRTSRNTSPGLESQDL